MLANVLLTTVLHCVSAFAQSAATGQHPLSSQVDVDSVQHTAGTYKKVTHDGIFDHVAVASLPDYQLRVQSSKSLCDPSVKQYSGYLDVSRKKHLFFWFFESRKDPHKAPLAVWMNGGPGGSSALGLTMENGPCSVQPGGNSTAWNPYAWNEVANMFYLDQPAGVGYSYSTASHVIDSTKDAAKDFYAFLQLFLARFPEYSQLPFHVLSESYGGQYAPNFASYINQQNKIHRNTLGSTTHIPVNLESVLIVNGMVSPRIQSEMVPEYACRGPYAFWDNDGEHCALLRSRVPRLRQLFKMCEDFETTLTCLPAVIFAFGSMNEGFEKLGLNVYDVRRNCTHPPLCYEQMEWAQDYMNRTDVKTALGVPSRHNYSMISWEINSAFFLAGDVHNDASPMIRELVEDGIRVLNLAGDADFACNFMGAFEWMHQLENPYAAEFRSMNNTVWKNKHGKAIGEVRAAGDSGGKTAGNYTWLSVYEAGHMVPHDQPEVSLNFFERWIKNQPIVDVV